MANRFLKRFLQDICYTKKLFSRQEEYIKLVYGVLNRSQSQMRKADRTEENAFKGSAKDAIQDSSRPELERRTEYESGHGKYCSGEEELGDSKWNFELTWLTKALEPALQLCGWALPTGNGAGNKIPPSGRSLAEIIASIQQSKIGFEGWSLSDLTIGLYLIYLRQASLDPFEDVKGVQISSESTVQDLIYHLEFAKGCYKGNAHGLAKHSMLRESNVLKYVKDSSVMRPGYYIGIDPRKKLIILGIRGTHTVYDLITDIVSSSIEEVTFEGYSTHFGIAEAARWFLTYEIGTIRTCLEKHEGFRLRLVGHSLGGAIASLLAIMLKKKSSEELGFSPEIVSAVGYATPPCVSKGLAESCSDFVTTVVMQDDIVPRLSAASLARLRIEILQTDWMSLIEKEDWKSVMGLVTNAKQVVSSVQDVAHKLADYAKFRSVKSFPAFPLKSKSKTENAVSLEKEEATGTMPEELFVPGTIYYIKKNIDTNAGSSRGIEFYTLWRSPPGEHFQRIVLSSKIISDHKCDSHQHALRDVIKGLPGANDNDILK
uniref:Fungal lipase-type domain-containing protein n=3 Tax=Rhizophora mucronata TaxID=61149 RepID=A0A2P2J7P5_RHIMU